MDNFWKNGRILIIYELIYWNDNVSFPLFFRCLQDKINPDITSVICTKAGIKGFNGSPEEGGESNTFSPTGPIDCKDQVVRPEFGRNK